MIATGKGRFSALLDGGGLIFFDGAMGTMIQAEGVSGYSCPEELNLARPDLIERIHAGYVAAGASVIETNTFGANARKLSRTGLGGRLRDVILAGVAAARRAAGDRVLVAGSVGPLGEFVEPVGSLAPAQAREIFGEAFRHFREAGVDLLLMETMSDLKEARAACLAAVDTGLPFAVTMTFEEDGRTVLGTPPEAAVATLEALGAAMLGANCGLGPEKLLAVLRRMAAVARRPLLAQPNAGLPVLAEGRTVFPADPEEFSRQMEGFLGAGVSALGGCCGTTPEHIRRMIARLRGKRPARPAASSGCRLASRSTCLLVGRPNPLVVIGERVNPTGRRRLAEELKAGTFRTVRDEVLAQVRAGAAMLDLNAGAPGLDEPAVLRKLTELAQKMTGAPLSIDSTNPSALESALEAADGRPLINSVNASRRSLEAILPLAARYGAAVIGLAMDEGGIPGDAAGRLRLAARIIEEAGRLGLAPSDILVDCLAVAAGSEQAQVVETLRAIQALERDIGAGSVLGVSNVSYGLPAREELNASFLAMAVYAGLDAAIVNPHSARIMEAVQASMVLVGRDRGAAAWIAGHAAGRGWEQAASPPQAGGLRESVAEAVMLGDEERLVSLVREGLDSGLDPMEVSQEHLIPALEKVGDLFEKKVFFLPQVIASAEAVRAAFAVVKERLRGSGEGQSARILLATVEGDIHDLGKNIVKSLLENHGYLVEDLGISVPPSAVAERVRRGGISLVGLSALMTTTLPAMEATVKLLKKEQASLPVIVGGAVLTADYAEAIGADGFAPDASRAVKLVRRLLAG